jgi:ATP-dependent Lon protease
MTEMRHPFNDDRDATCATVDNDAPTGGNWPSSDRGLGPEPLAGFEEAPHWQADLESLDRWVAGSPDSKVEIAYARDLLFSAHFASLPMPVFVRLLQLRGSALGEDLGELVNYCQRAGRRDQLIYLDGLVRLFGGHCWNLSEDAAAQVVAPALASLRQFSGTNSSEDETNPFAALKLGSLRSSLQIRYDMLQHGAGTEDTLERVLGRGPLYLALGSTREPPATLLMACVVRHDQVEMARLIFRYTDILRTEWLELALRHGSMDMILAAGENWRWQAWVDADGNTPAHLLAGRAGMEHYYWVVGYQGVDLEAKNRAGQLAGDLIAAGAETMDATEAPLDEESVDAESPAECQKASDRERLMLRLAEPEDVAEFHKRISVLDKDVKTRIEHQVPKVELYDRPLVAAPEPTVLAGLRERFPLFREAIDDIAAQVNLQWRLAGKTGLPQPLRLPNMLFVGAPGWGKSHFVRALAEALSLPFREFQMSSMSAGFILSGSDSTWQSSRPGQVFEMLAHGQCANPAILLDEIDKLPSDGRYPVDGPLYALLEKSQARQFRDEFADFPIDASHINWFASANDPDRIAPAIASRFEIYELPTPSQDEARATARAVFTAMMKNETWATLFDPEPSEDVIEILARHSPREAIRLLVKGFGRAGLEGRLTLSTGDIVTFAARSAPARRIGF